VTLSQRRGCRIINRQKIALDKVEQYVIEESLLKKQVSKR
jgi:hypothetical protein